MTASASACEPNRSRQRCEAIAQKNLITVMNTAIPVPGGFANGAGLTAIFGLLNDEDD